MPNKPIIIQFKHNILFKYLKTFMLLNLIF